MAESITSFNKKNTCHCQQKDESELCLLMREKVEVKWKKEIFFGAITKI